MAKLIPVDSSMIDAVGYDPKTKELLIKFNSDKTYCYKEVPLKVYKELMESNSKGRYMRDAIIDFYPYSQIKSKWR